MKQQLHLSQKFKAAEDPGTIEVVLEQTSLYGVNTDDDIARTKYQGRKLLQLGGTEGKRT